MRQSTIFATSIAATITPKAIRTRCQKSDMDGPYSTQSIGFRPANPSPSPCHCSTRSSPTHQQSSTSCPFRSEGKSSKPRSRSLTTTPTASSSATAEAASSARFSSSACAASGSPPVTPPPSPPIASTRSLCSSTSLRMRVRSATRRSAGGRTATRALLASAGVKRRFGTAPSNGRDGTTRLAWWFALVAALVALQYAGRYSDMSERSSPLYTWTFLGASIGQELFFLLLIVAIGGLVWQRYGVRRPNRVGQAAAFAVGIFVTVNVFETMYALLLHPGNEQGLTPDHWQPAHAAAYVANGIVICTLVPIVEELTFRGVGFALLEPFGTRTAIVVPGVLFGLSHGLFLELPIIVLFGLLLGVLRARTGSIVPGIFLHSAFNLYALIAAVTIGG